jgi:hypothetical protein
MKKVPVVITIVTLFALFFQFMPYLGISDQIIFGMFLLSPLVVLYMAYVILKYGKPSAYTFEERFYDDYDYVRNGREETDVKN